MSAPQRTHAFRQLREMILAGAFASGERLTEVGVAERLGISRTPVRQALPALCQEGLLVAIGKRGYAVREFTHQESIDALVVRSMMEGYAARCVAEQGASPELIAALKECLATGDAILSKVDLGEEDEVRYGEMNQRFHQVILDAAARPIVREVVDRCELVPFVGTSQISFGPTSLNEVFHYLFYAHQQHHLIVEAIASGDGARAEMLFREHALTQKRSMSL